MPEFTLKDSGERAEFASGMVRDVTKGKLDIWRVFLGPMLRRLARHVTLGAVKYPDVRPGVPNWTLASGEEELQRYRDSAARHFEQWMQGETDEDHAAAVFFNINGAEYVKERRAQMIEKAPAPVCAACGPECANMQPATAKTILLGTLPAGTLVTQEVLDNLVAPDVAVIDGLPVEVALRWH